MDPREGVGDVRRHGVENAARLGLQGLQEWGLWFCKGDFAVMGSGSCVWKLLNPTAIRDASIIA
jgi:hypothetical protein